MDDLFNHAAQVSVAFGIVESSEFRGRLVQFCIRLSVPVQQPHLHHLSLKSHYWSQDWAIRTCVTCEDRAATFPLIPDDPTHLVDLAMGC